MKEFYSRMFGAQPVNTQWTDKWALFDSAGARFALHAVSAEHAQDIEVSSPAVAREGNPVKLIFGVDNVLVERTRLEELGIKMVQRSWQKFDEACDGIDPEGNIFQISKSI